MTLTAIYRGLCPNCGGPISSQRLEKGLPCSSCLPSPPEVKSEERGELVKTIGRSLAERGRLSAYWRLMDVEESLDEFEEFFEKATGYRLWSAQRTWARRLLIGESFAIIAPTGVGKSTLLAVYAVYRASKGGRVYLLTPTESLAKQTVARISQLCEKLGIEVRLAYFYSSLKSSEKIKQLEAIRRGEYEILVTTSSFLSRRMNLVESYRFDLVEVDDVDSLLKSSRNIDRVLYLLGFPPEIVESAHRLVIVKINLMRSRLAGDSEKASKLLEELRLLERRIQEFVSQNSVGQLVLASATGRAGGLRAKAFRELLGFEAGGIHEYLRKVDVASHPLTNLLDDVLRITRLMGPGGLIFVSKDLGKEVAKRIVEHLSSNGVRARLALSGRRFLEQFAEGKLDVLVGMATYYGVIVRGIDIPERVRYTVFVGVPKFTINLERAVQSPTRLLQLLLYLADKGDEKARDFFTRISRLIERLGYGELMVVRIALANGETPKGFLGKIVDELVEAGKYAVKTYKKLLDKEGKIVIGSALARRKEKEYVIEIPDAMTFIQASGRASRLYKGRMTYGLAIILHEEKELVDLLEKKLSYYIDGFRIKSLEDVDLDRVKRLIEETRRGGSNAGVKVRSVLLVVESPTKAKTIAGFFGKPSRRRLGSVTVYEVPYTDPETGETLLLSLVASRGHLFDLVVDEGMHGVLMENGDYIPVYATIKRCMKCGHQFVENLQACPRCGSNLIRDQYSVVSALRRLAIEVDEVLIGTDPDTEGEKIAWDIYLALKPYNPRIARIEFHEVTRRALIDALKKPRKISKGLVAAQTVRRITDRWIGFELSQLLWKVYNKHWLGAGRVQTPVLGWIIERYSEWKAGRGYVVRARLETGYRLRIFEKEKEEAKRIAEEMLRNGVKVEKLEIEEKISSPPPPFTTDSLLYEASLRLGFSSSKTMRIAQELFESGLITYHRTSSTYVSPVGREIARKYITEKLGKPGLYLSRQWGEQGAHEAIRPTRPIDAQEVKRLIVEGSLRIHVKFTEAHYRLYDLIFRRFVASQMAPAKLKIASAKLGIGGKTITLEAPVEVVEEGYTAIQPPRIEEWLLRIGVGGTVRVEDVVVSRGSRTRLYVHGDVVKLMRERRLGRPSTYAKILSSIRRHGYIVESRKRKYLIPTKLGITVYKYLTENMNELVSEATTRKLEEEMDLVERGEKEYKEIIEELRGLLEQLVPSALKAVESVEAG